MIIKHMHFNMVLKRIAILAFLMTLLPIPGSGQVFRFSYATPNPESNVFRDFRRSLERYENDSLVFRSEPIFHNIRYVDGFDLAAVSIPLNSVDNSKRRRYPDPIWVCVDDSLRSVFYFPRNTLDVRIDTTLQLFLYTDMVSMNYDWYWRGAITFDGEVLFKPPFWRIRRNKDYYWGFGYLQELRDPLFAERNIKIVDIRTRQSFYCVCKEFSSDALDYSRSPLHLDAEVVNSSQYANFDRAWGHLLMNGNVSGAIRYFKLASKGPYKIIEDMARFNVKALKRLSKQMKRASK